MRQLGRTIFFAATTGDTSAIVLRQVVAALEGKEPHWSAAPDRCYLFMSGHSKTGRPPCPSSVQPLTTQPVPAAMARVRVLIKRGTAIKLVSRAFMSRIPFLVALTVGR